MLAENPLAFWVLYLIKYIGNFTYFIWDAMARLLKTSGLASGNTTQNGENKTETYALYQCTFLHMQKFSKSPTTHTDHVHMAELRMWKIFL